MPTSYVQKVAKAKGKSVQWAENKWQSAKAQAESEGKPDNYGYIVSIFKNMTRTQANLESIVASVLTLNKQPEECSGFKPQPTDEIHKIDSSFLKAAVYRPKSKELYLKLVGKPKDKVYVYYNVTKKEVSDFLTSESKGRYYSTKIKEVKESRQLAKLLEPKL